MTPAAAMFACKQPLSVDAHDGVNAEAEAGFGLCGTARGQREIFLDGAHLLLT